MSYINTALKKVQKERDERYVPYNDLISSSRVAALRIGSRRSLILPAAVIVIFTMISLAGYFYLTADRPANDAVEAGAGTETVDKTTAAGSHAPDEDSAKQTRAAKLYEEALKAQRGERWAEAGNFYKQALAVEPEHIQSLNNLGVLYMTWKRYDEALELFVRAMAAREDYVDPYYNLACLYARLDNEKACLDYLERAIKIDGRAREWAKTDYDFKKLTLLPEFRKLTGK